LTTPLPNGWTATKVRDIGSVQLGRQRSPDVHQGANMRPYLRVANVFEDRIDLSDVMEMHFEPKEVERYELGPGDILLNEGQSRELVGRPAMYRGELPGVCFTNSLVRFQASSAVDRDFALHLFRHWLKNGSFQAIAQITTNIAHLGAGRFGDMTVPLPPLNEQRRIVAKLEALQARSRRAREALDAVPPLLEKLRQSILAAAFRGDLTKDWREKHKDVEPLDISIRDSNALSRKHLWGSGRTAESIDPSWGPLPPSWRWVRVRDLNENAGAAVQIGPMSMRSNEFVSEGTTVLNVGCIQRGRIDVSKADFLPPDRAKDFERYRLRAGDVLFTRSGTVGRCALLSEELDGAVMTFHLLRVRPSHGRCAPGYLMYAFQGCSVVAAQIEASSVGATRAGFNTRLLEEMWIPMAPREEQIELLDHIAEYMSLIDAMCSRVTLLRLKLETAERSTLSKAFRGELVPQDPNDEPAEAMLARLRESNGAEDSSGNGRKNGAGRPRARTRA